MSGLNRAQLQQAIDYLTGQQASFGEAAVLTALEVLEEQLAALPEELPIREAPAALPGEQRKQITILFAAIDGFTRLSGATRNTARLRQIDLLWRRLDETILNHGGVVDKHMGDVIMGIFGAPVSHEDDPERAVRCAMALRELVSEFLAEQDAPSEEDGPLLPSSIMRIGINTGQMVIGNMGSDIRFDYTAIGDAVNLGSRLEGANKLYGTGILISDDTYQMARDHILARQLDLLRVKGKQEPVKVYELMAMRDDKVDIKTREVLNYFQQGYQHYLAQNWEWAMNQFRQALQINRDDEPSRLYLLRCQEFLHRPPGKDWDGVYTLKTK